MNSIIKWLSKLTTRRFWTTSLYSLFGIAPLTSLHSNQDLMSAAAYLIDPVY